MARHDASIQGLLSHPALRALAEATRGTPWDDDLWLVGGAVRDALLGRPVQTDFDLVTLGDPEALAAALWEAGLATHPPAVFARFGTAMVSVEGATLEFVRARAESYSPDSRKPSVVAGTYDEDTLRRDFTVNTLRANLHDGALCDATGLGLSDLAAGILRTPTDPCLSFADDALRILRAIRFRAQLGFRYAPELEAAMTAERHRMAILSAERIRDEFSKLMLAPGVVEGLRDLRKHGLLPWVMPELEPMAGVTQGRWHHLDVWDHTLAVIGNSAADDLILRLACLLHDVGKPKTRSIDDEGQVRFFTHEHMGAEMAREALLRLRFSHEMVDRVARLVKHHMRLGQPHDWSVGAVRRLVRDLDDDLQRLFALARADQAGCRTGVPLADLDAIERRFGEVMAVAPRETLRPPLDGTRVMEILGCGPGPRVGQVLQALLERVLDGDLAPDDLAAAERWVADTFGRGATSGESDR